MFYVTTRQFVPLTPPVVIPGSSYAIQIGHIDGVYHVQIKRGPSVIATVKLYSLDINEITAVVYSSMKLPMFNMFNIAKAVGRALNALESNIEKQPYGEPISVEEMEQRPQMKYSTHPPQSAPSTTPSESASRSPSFPSQRTEEPPKTLEGLIKRQKEIEERKKEVKIEKLSLEEKWERSVATINLILALSSKFLSERYGMNAVEEFWEYYAKANAEIWKNIPLSSFEETISNIINWLEIQGIQFSQYTIENETFQGIIDDCLFKKRAESLKNLGITLPEGFPCTLCKAQLSHICDVLNLHFDLEKEATYCKITLKSKKGEKKVVL